MMEAAQQGYHSELIELSQEENNLLSRHNHLFSTVMVDWNGVKVKSSLMTPEIESKDRSIRKQASRAISAAWEEKREELEEIYDKLVKNRDEQAKRLGLDKLYCYDNRICFLEGNPLPLYDTKGCLEATRKMYTQMLPETAEFIAFLLDNELYDVEIREKCWFTSEAAETHAMAMEFFAWPYMELFFGERAEDYRIMHLENALSLIARECEQDEFQQLVYENPAMSKAELSFLLPKHGNGGFYDADKACGTG